MSRFLSPLWRAEIRAYWQLAWPIVVAQLSFIGMGSIDTVLAGRLGASQLAAVAVGANLFFLLFVFFSGLFMAVAASVAQAIGRGRTPAEIGDFVRGSLLLAVLSGVLWGLLMRALWPPVAALLNLDAETRTYADGYVHALAWSTLPFCLSFVLRNTADAHGLTRVALITGVIALIFNAGAAYTLMLGRFGLPALGPAGTGYATSLSGALMVLVYIALFQRYPALRALRLWRSPRMPGLAPWLASAREVLRIGAPTAAILTAEASLFQIGALIIARFGAVTMAAHQVAINFASLMFMVPMSIGMAATVRVGLAAGAGDPAAVALRGRVGMLLGFAFALCSASFMLSFPGAIVAVYTQVDAVAVIATRFLAFAAVFQIFDCIQATANGALRGIKDTRMPMLITVTAYWVIALPLSLWLALHTVLAATGIWCGFIAGLAVAAAGLSLRFISHARHV